MSLISLRPLASAMAVVCATASVTVAAPIAAAETACATPDSAAQFAAADPAALGFDPAKLDDALTFGKSKGAWAIRVYRHGCLAGRIDYDSRAADKLPTPLASSSKGVLSLAVGRAITLGLFGLDDPIGRYFPEADPAHAAITIRQVLNQTTGLKFDWAGTGAGIATDEVQQVLHAPFVAPPGTTFDYAQAVLNILVETIERTSGQRFLDWIQPNLFTPLGIPRDYWVWLTDRGGEPSGAGGLAMRPDSDARLGQLMLRQGTWNGQRLIDADYIRQAVQPTSANGGYGFLYWLNAGDSYKTASVPKATVFAHPMFPGSPRDLYSFVGALGQFITIVPSLDLVVVRTGIPQSIDPGNIQVALAAESNPDNKELMRRITAAVADTPPVPYDDPYRYGDNLGPIIADLGDAVEWTDPALVAQLLLGYGPESIPGCGIVFCDNSNVVSDVLAVTTDTFNQIARAVTALPR
ncbi:serine hydrolase domain-containing protein [Nocardia terpenica]|nr:serine hydrolase [Nocardia terpenica]